MRFDRYTLLILILMTQQLVAQTITGSFPFGGETRDYRLYVPSNYTGNTLVFNLHGYTSNATDQQNWVEMDLVADTGNFIVCYPNGVANAWNSWWGTGVDDVGFISALIDTLSSQYNIDPNNVFSCGMSNGGYMSYMLACELTERIRAIASVTGSMSLWAGNNCSISKAMPVMQIHGTADPTVLYDGGAGEYSVEGLVDFWVGKNNCQTPGDSLFVPDVNTGDNCTAIRVDYDNGDDNAKVAFYRIDGGEHTWPGANFDIGVTNHDFHGSSEIWNFFRQYVVVSNRIETVQSKEPLLLYAKGSEIRLMSNEKQRVRLVGLDGRLLFDQLINGGAIVDVKLGVGVYVAIVGDYDSFRQKIFIGE